LALVVLSVVEQRLDAVRAVLAGADVVEVAARVGVHRSTLHRWISRYLAEQVAGLADRSHRPASCPHQAAEVVEVAVAEMRREHPRWGSRRIRLELLRGPLPWSDPLSASQLVVPSERTIDRILIRQGLLRQRKARRPRESYRRFERPGPMQLWGVDIVGGIQLVDTATGVLREAKIVTGVDDHSRFCVMAAVIERATGRAVCVAFAQALARFGVPEEVITDNGKQFTDRFSRYGPSRGEVLFDKICRKNGITHRLTAPASPNQNGKVERFHGTFRPDFLEDANPFETLEAAQAAVDAWVEQYNHQRPHQGLHERVPVTPADRFQPVPAADRGLVATWLPATLEPAVDDAVPEPVPETVSGAVRLTKPVPASGNMSLGGQQFWLGPTRVGQLVEFWVSPEWVHLSIGGTRIKSLRSHLTVADIARLRAQGAAPAGPPPITGTSPGTSPDGEDPVVEVERTVARPGTVALGGHVVLAAEILAGRRVGVRIEPATLMFFDLETRELLRTRPNPLAPEQIRGLRGMRPVGPVPRPSTEPVRVQRRASNTGVITVARQQVALGRGHAGQTVTVLVSETTLAIELADHDGTETRLVRRTNTNTVRSIKGQRPRTADTSVS
jgi:transposase InsO family protein